MTALGKVAMKHAGVTLVTATTALAVAAAPAATAAPVQPDRAGLQERLDDVVAAGAVGALAEVRDEHGVWRGTSGVAELGTTRAVPVHGRFRVGSITKTFVATVVLQLVDEGRLRLDDTVEKWLPGVVPDGDRITVRQLLNHTSGLYDYLHTLPLPPSRSSWTTGGGPGPRPNRSSARWPTRRRSNRRVRPSRTRTPTTSCSARSSRR